MVECYKSRCHSSKAAIDLRLTHGANLHASITSSAQPRDASSRPPEQEFMNICRHAFAFEIGALTEGELTSRASIATTVWFR